MSDTVPINLPGKFCTWFDGTNLAQGLDDIDPECKETRVAYEEGRSVKTGNGGYYVRLLTTSTVLKLLAEYADYCLEANGDDPDKAETDAAKKVLRRVAEARQLTKEQGQ